jgi:hypothetical protein
MQIVHAAVAKVVLYQAYVIFGWMFVTTVLAAFILIRQRRVASLAKIAAANFENIRGRLDEAAAQQKRLFAELGAAVGKMLKELQGDQKKAAMETTGLGGRVDRLGGSLRDQLLDLQNAVAAAGGRGAEAAVAQLAARVEELADELAWSHHYYDDLRTLEAAVTGLVGPEKLRQLLDKEKSAASRAGAREEIARKR